MNLLQIEDSERVKLLATKSHLVCKPKLINIQHQGIIGDSRIQASMSWKEDKNVLPIKKEFLTCVSDCAQRSCGVSLMGNIQEPSGCDSEQCSGLTLLEDEVGPGDPLVSLPT